MAGAALPGMISRRTLSGADLNRANLAGAALTEAILTKAILSSGPTSAGPPPSRADVFEALLWETVFGDTNLTAVQGLETLPALWPQHPRPSHPLQVRTAAPGLPPGLWPARYAD